VRGTKRKRREGVWEVRAYLGRDPVSGKPRQVSKTVYGSAKAADEALRDLIDKQAPRSDGMGASFGQLLDRWLIECERLDLSPTTMRTYRAQIEQTIRPALGKVPLTRLNAKQLDDLYGAMKTADKTPKTIRNHHAIISAALHQAVRWGWVRTNIAEQAKPPRVSQRRVKAPSVDVVRARSSRRRRSVTHGWRRCSCSAPSPACDGASCAPSGGPTSTWSEETWRSPAPSSSYPAVCPRSRPRRTALVPLR
jgi:integrase